MAEIKINVPEKPEYNWEEFIMKVIELKMFEFELEKSNKLKLLILKALTSKNALTEEESEKFSIELSNKIKDSRLALKSKEV